jgi:hypothetical protein
VFETVCEPFTADCQVDKRLLKMGQCCIDFAMIHVAPRFEAELASAASVNRILNVFTRHGAPIGLQASLIAANQLEARLRKLHRATADDGLASLTLGASAKRLRLPSNLEPRR